MERVSTVWAQIAQPHSHVPLPASATDRIVLFPSPIGIPELLEPLAELEVVLHLAFHETLHGNDLVEGRGQDASLTKCGLPFKRVYLINLVLLECILQYLSSTGAYELRHERMFRRGRVSRTLKFVMYLQTQRGR